MFFQMKWISFLFFALFCKNLWAQAPVAPSGDKEVNLPTSKGVTKTRKVIEKSSVKVVKEQEGFFFVSVGDRKVRPDDYVLFVRPFEGELDILARGQIKAKQEGMALVELKIENISKIPRIGDYAVFMAPPWTPDPEKDKEDATGFLKSEPPPIPGDPGYIEFDMGQFNSNLTTTGAPIANEAKNVAGYTFNYMHFVWYLEFLWRLGIEIERIAGAFPTTDYNRRSFDSSQNITNFKLNYRMRKFEDFWNTRLTFKLINTTDTFDTSNEDAFLISTVYAGLGLGAEFNKEFSSGVWKPKGNLGFNIHKIYLDLNYFPQIGAVETIVSRGEEAAVTALEYRIGFESFLYIGWIPWFKRYVIKAFYGQRSYNLQFSGATESEFLPVDENASYTETYDYWVVSFGIRLEDVVGQFFMPRQK